MGGMVYSVSPVNHNDTSQSWQSLLHENWSSSKRPLRRSLQLHGCKRVGWMGRNVARWPNLGEIVWKFPYFLLLLYYCTNRYLVWWLVLFLICTTTCKQQLCTIRPTFKRPPIEKEWFIWLIYVCLVLCYWHSLRCGGGMGKAVDAPSTAPVSSLL